MRGRFLLSALFVLPALLTAGSAFGGEAPAVVEASLDVDTATTGDLVTYRLRVEYDKAYRADLPEIAEELGGLRVVERGVEGPKRAGLFSRRRVLEGWYRLRADLVGSYELPAMEVAVREAPAERATEGQEGSSQGSPNHTPSPCSPQ